MSHELAPLPIESIEPAPQPTRRGSAWPWIVGALLAITVIKYLVVLTTIAADPSIAIEEDYYRRALAWDASREARAESDALGWEVRTAIGRRSSPGEGALLTVAVVDRVGKPIAGANVTARVFHRARAATPFDTTGVTDLTGGFQLELAAARRGLWELELEIEQGEDRFIETRTLIFGARATGAGP